MNDLCVTKIFNLYKRTDIKWRREHLEPRGKDGLVLFLEGEIEYIFTQGSITAKPGTLLLLPGNIPYRGRALTEPVTYFVLDFESASENMLTELGAPCIASPQSFAELEAGFAEALSAWQLQHLDTVFRVKSFLFWALSVLVKESGGIRPHSQLSALLAYISDHYADKDLTATLLCKKFFISESQLRRNILKATGLTTNEYITSLRINRAKQELICTEKSIQQIASEQGFASPYYFSRCFHKHTALSPKEYRKQNRAL